MSLKPSDASQQAGGVLDGESLLRAAALGAAQDSGEDIGVSEGVLFGKKPATAVENGSSAPSTSSGPSSSAPKAPASSEPKEGGKDDADDEDDDAEAPRGRRMRSSGMGGELGGYTQMSWLRVPPPESARKRGRGAVTMSEVRQHRKADDAWTVVRGKVYDITPYMKFHPGGEKELMKGAGRDSSSLFNKYHPWVNVDFLLEKCFLGILVPE